MSFVSNLHQVRISQHLFRQLFGVVLATFSERLMVRERGLRIIYNDYVSSYKELLRSSCEDLLYVSRLKKLAVFVLLII